MSKMKVAGSRDANLKDNRTGKEINGVFLLVDYLDESVTRMIAEKIFVSAYMLAEFGYASVVGDGEVKNSAECEHPKSAA